MVYAALARDSFANQAEETAGILCVFQGFHCDALRKKIRQGGAKLFGYFLQNKNWIASSSDPTVNTNAIDALQHCFDSASQSCDSPADVL